MEPWIILIMKKNTLSGIEGSHDTILVLFQKNETTYSTDKISHRPEDIATMSTKKGSLNHTLDCQKLIKRSKFSNRGTIAAEFRPTKPPDFDAIVQKSKVRYETWCTLRYLSHKSEDIHSIPSFSAVNSFLQNDKPMKTKVAFTPILPYVATEYDTVHTAISKMSSFRSLSHMIHFDATRACIDRQKSYSY